MSSINARTARYEIWKKGRKVSGKFTLTATPVLSAANVTIGRDHKEVADMMVGTFAIISEDSNCPAKFIQYKQRVEREELVFNESNVEREDYAVHLPMKSSTPH